MGTQRSLELQNHIFLLVPIHLQHLGTCELYKFAEFYSGGPSRGWKG